MTAREGKEEANKAVITIKKKLPLIKKMLS
jgi:hypothetical protein